MSPMRQSLHLAPIDSPLSFLSTRPTLSDELTYSPTPPPPPPPIPPLPSPAAITSETKTAKFNKHDAETLKMRSSYPNL